MVVRKACYMLFSGILLLLLAGTIAGAQVIGRHELGLRAYNGFYAQSLPEGDRYRPLVIAPYYHYYLGKKETGSKIGIYLEPQVAVVSLDYAGEIRNKDKDLHTHEYGFNAGISYSYWWRRMAVYIGLGSGPNFISVQTDRQAGGFIFSDNLYVGIKEMVLKHYYLDLHFRARHISNAGLKSPNAGINNAFIGLGLSRLF